MIGISIILLLGKDPDWVHFETYYESFTTAKTMEIFDAPLLFVTSTPLLLPSLSTSRCRRCVQANPQRQNGGKSVTQRGVKTTQKRVRKAPTCNLDINKTSNSDREDEIASKIASLRKQKRLKSQYSSNSPPSAPPSQFKENDAENQQPSAAVGQEKDDDRKEKNEKDPSENVGNAVMARDEMVNDTAADNNAFSQLPDWKKEEILLSQMSEAESFFNRPTITPEPTQSPPPQQQPQESADSDQDEDETYKPKVSTWGVYPRPDNISRAFGGGRGIPSDGVDLGSPKQKERDEQVSAKLAAYRAARGVDTSKEEEHKSEIDTALSLSETYMRNADAVSASRELEKVTEFVSGPAASRVGGNVWLALALAYEACARRSAAKQIYKELKGNPYDEIARKAKQLLQGFSDMESLGFRNAEEEINSDDVILNGNSANTTSTGMKVMDFKVPDLNFASDKRYETVVIPSSVSSTPEKVGLGVNIALLALVVSPALLICILILLRQSQN